ANPLRGLAGEAPCFAGRNATRAPCGGRGVDHVVDPDGIGFPRATPEARFHVHARGAAVPAFRPSSFALRKRSAAVHHAKSALRVDFADAPIAGVLVDLENLRRPCERLLSPPSALRRESPC